MFYRMYKELVVERLRVTGYPAFGTRSESRSPSFKPYLMKLKNKEKIYVKKICDVHSYTPCPKKIVPFFYFYFLGAQCV
jgi:hypothetical protein